MPLQVPCPKCQTILKVPDDAIGKRVKCKKCDERFMIAAPIAPSENAPVPVLPVVLPPVDTVGESQMLSVAESLSTLPPANPASSADPFAFDTGSAPAGNLASSAEVPPSANPFGFDEGDSVVSVRSKSGKRPEPKKPTAADALKGSKDNDDDKPRSRKKPEPAKSNKKLLLILGGCFMALFLGCAGIGVGAYFWIKGEAQKLIDQQKTATSNTKDKDAGKTTTPPTTAKEAEPKPKGGDTKGKANETKGATGRKGEPKLATEPEAKMTESAPPAMAMSKLPGLPKEATKVLAKPRLTYDVNIPFTDILDVKTPSKNADRVAILYRSNAGFQGAGAKDTVEIHDLNTKKIIGKREFPADGSVNKNRRFAFCPHGDSVAIEENGNKLSIWTFDVPNLMADKINPFEGLTDSSGKIHTLEFFDELHLMVIDDTLVGQTLKTVEGKVIPQKSVPKPSKPGVVLARSNAGVGYAIVENEIHRLWMRPTEVAVFDNRMAKLTTPGTPLQFAVDGRGKATVTIFGGKPTTLQASRAVDGQGPLIPLPDGLGKPLTPYFPYVGTIAAIPFDNGLVPQTLLLDLESSTLFALLTDTGAAKHITDLSGHSFSTIRPKATDPTKCQLIQTSSDLDDLRKLVNEASTSKTLVPLVFTDKGIMK
ncbi:MAG: MJ0042-type zinc finger domain-containing protein [Fimbriiglobus sp.]